MRKQVIAGNWKMNKNLTEAVELVSGLKVKLSGKKYTCDVIICPPFTNLETVSSLTKDTDLQLGAQNMCFQDKGAFTGEISADMLKSVGCAYVILGHSERRTIFKETDEVINKKMKQALSNGLKPIFCIGETLEEREQNITIDVVKRQVTEGLKDISAEEMKNIILAYEPVWAIGTGKTASPEQAQEVHAEIRKLVAELYTKEVADALVIQYGGSVKANNAEELLSQPDIDGALVGGACLTAEDFAAIIEAAK